jgi:FkbM family methyltransferase
MARHMRRIIERVLQRLPVSRAVYAQRDQLQQEIEELRGSTAAIAGKAAQLAPRADELSATSQVVPHDPLRLQTQVPVIRTAEQRILLATRCRDADGLPKVADAGAVTRQPDGTHAQIMHNGIKVVAGGYYGAWMQDLIGRCRGHHEPQEEVLFAEVLRHMSGNATMLELGGFWSFYSIWFLAQDRRRRSFVVEADPAHIEIGRINAQLNDCHPVFIHAVVAAAPAPPGPFVTEASGTMDLPCVSVAGTMATHGIGRLDLLHCDAQGIELAVLQSCGELAASGRLGWVMLSTHSHHISGDPLTHQRCLAVLAQAGATILAEHDVQESFSGDGLIVAKFGDVPATWRTPRLSYNRASESLFRNPLYDLAAAPAAPSPVSPVSPLPAPLAFAPSAPMQLLARSETFAARGGLLELTEDCALGRQGDKILLPFDRVMFPWIVSNRSWEADNLDFLAQHIDPARSYRVIDIGANVGLFSRQAALRFPNLANFICVEADPEHFRALRYNLAGLLDGRSAMWNVALSHADGEARFLRDKDNSGNYSLNDDAMRDRPFDAITVRSVATDRWMREHVHLDADAHAIWKSDTQGHDELIISLTPLDVWNHVDVAIIELWRIRKPDFDRAAFIQRIDAFPHKFLGPNRPTATTEILTFLDSDDWDHTDLYIWR